MPGGAGPMPPPAGPTTGGTGGGHAGPGGGAAPGTTPGASGAASGVSKPVEVAAQGLQREALLADLARRAQPQAAQQRHRRAPALNGLLGEEDGRHSREREPAPLGLQVADQRAQVEAVGDDDALGERHGQAVVTRGVRGDEDGEPVETRVFVVGPDVRFGVVSDIDDTVMVTTIPRPLLAAWNSFVVDEHARQPVPGMAVLMERLVRDIPGDSDDVAITQAIISLAKAMGLRVVAEGVETEAQLAFLVAHGCDDVQGNLFCAPCPGSETERIFAPRA